MGTLRMTICMAAILLLQVAAVVAELCLTSCRCCKTTTEVRERPTMLGGYTQERPLTKEEVTLFDKAYKGEVALRPVSVATQVVAGINYSNSNHIMLRENRHYTWESNEEIN